MSPFVRGGVPVVRLWIVGLICALLAPSLTRAADEAWLDTVLYGASYYHEYMPYERLEKDAQLMEDAGVTVVRVGESTWSSWEPREGKFEFAWIEGLPSSFTTVAPTIAFTSGVDSPSLGPEAKPGSETTRRSARAYDRLRIFHPPLISSVRRAPNKATVS